MLPQVLLIWTRQACSAAGTPRGRPRPTYNVPLWEPWLPTIPRKIEGSFRIIQKPAFITCSGCFKDVIESWMIIYNYDVYNEYSLIKDCVQQHLPAQVWVSYVFPLISRPPLVFTNHSWGSRQHHLPTCWHTYFRCQKIVKVNQESLIPKAEIPTFWQFIY